MLFYVFLVIFVFVSIFPLLWVFKMSIVTKAELYATPPTSRPPHQRSPSGRLSWATRRSTGAHEQRDRRRVTTVICLFFGSICAYAISRLRFRFKSP